MSKLKRPPALVMNMFYTGLGIARSLGEHGIPVIGLTSSRRIYGNFTRYAKTVFSPDSRNNPEALLACVLKIGKELGQRGVIFPTRDDDVVWLDRFRKDLEPYFSLVIPDSSIVQSSLSKWETYLWAREAGVATPKCWLIEGAQHLEQIASELTYPCVLKPVSSHHWRLGGNWELVGGRKVVKVSSREELTTEYASVARAGQRVLVQEMIPGSDEGLVVAACYLDRKSNWIASFNTQKLLQSPEGFGTGCIVQAVDRPELLAPTKRLLQKMNYTGIAEVEYKWHETKNEFQLIEVNPRPWDQHRLGKSCGKDLVYFAYCDHAGLPMPPVSSRKSVQKWIAEDTLVLTALRLLRRRDPKLRSLLRLARGKRLYAIWSISDPLPAVAYFATRFIPGLIAAGIQFAWATLLRPFRVGTAERELLKSRLEKGSSHV